MKKLKHITVSQEVYQKLKYLGTAGDSFNDVLIKILKVIEKNKENRSKLLQSDSRVGALDQSVTIDVQPFTTRRQQMEVQYDK